MANLRDCDIVSTCKVCGSGIMSKDYLIRPCRNCEGLRKLQTEKEYLGITALEERIALLEKMANTNQPTTDLD